MLRVASSTPFTDTHVSASVRCWRLLPARSPRLLLVLSRPWISQAMLRAALISARAFSNTSAAFRLQAWSGIVDPRLVWEAVDRKDSDVLVFDVEGTDYRAGHVPGAFSWPSSQFKDGSGRLSTEKAAQTALREAGIRSDADIVL
jgi:hypothetical protein